MTEAGRILVADDDETFLHSTADLLRREGYCCDCVADAHAAAAMLRAASYDLLICDIKMPGNVELEFVKMLPGVAKDIPIILVTGYPSLDTAMESVELSVVSYMVKPLDFDKLLAAVQMGMEIAATSQAVNATRKRLEDWNRDLTDLGELIRIPRSGAAAASTSTFLNLTISNMVGALLDLKNVAESVADRDGEAGTSRLLGPRGPEALVEGLKEAIAVLKKTKRAFKSRELGELREKLEALVEEVGRT